jgi:hypothetical protein
MTTEPSEEVKEEARYRAILSLREGISAMDEFATCMETGREPTFRMVLRMIEAHRGLGYICRAGMHALIMTLEEEAQ